MAQTRRRSPQKGDVKDLFTAKLQESKLDDASIIKKLQFKVRSNQQPMAGLPSASAGFYIPYFDVNGKRTDFWRYRYLESTNEPGSFEALTNRKQLRYVQAKESVNELYLPPLVNWAKVAKDVAQPIIITEGELKAACACAWSGVATIGLGGVWCFRSARKHAHLLPAFADFEWKGRKVFITYDSDAVVNPKVMAAENALAYELTNLGAEPHVVRIPPLEGGTKCGLDDYIVREGADLTELLESASPWIAAQELHKLNEEVVYVRDPGLVLRIDTKQRMAPRAFTDHAYSTRIYYEQQATEKGTKMVEKSAAKEWLRWPYRAEAQRVVYEPGEDIVIGDTFNVWPGWGAQPMKGDVTLWGRLMDYMFDGDKAARKWFERWLAYPLQHPGAKLYSSPLIWGQMHGTGKSFIGYSMFKIYGANATEIGDKQLYESHNEWAENKQFVMGDEITGGDKRATSDKMKSIITQQQLRINPKYIPSYTVRDCINYYFTSNHPDSFFLEDNDRRFFIWEAPTTPLPFEFYKDYERWIGAPNVQGPGVAALFHYLLSLDLGDFDPAAPAPVTDAKRDMTSLSKSDFASWVSTLKESPDTVLRMNGTPVPFVLWRAEDVLRLYDPEGKGKLTVNGVARELRRQGFRQAYRGQGVPTQTDGQVRLWVLRPMRIVDMNNGVGCGKLYDQERAMPVRREKHK